jgi:DNA-binding PadR family transcriptional regulator
MNFTIPTALILQALEQGYSFGFQIMDVTGLPSGTVYPALRRLENEGLITSRWEAAEAALEADRPARRYYEVTKFGEEWLREARERLPAVSKLLPAEVAKGDASA